MGSAETIVIAGATGFVGRALAARLRERYRVIGLSRRPEPLPLSGVAWRQCDLFSLLECEAALAGAAQAVFLVHSMLPSARLTQGAFADLDLVIADNFARAAARAGVRQIVYLGGLVPDAPELSAHLTSRLEVEATLGARGIPVTALRAGIVVGAGGASFEMLVRLVRRLPVVPCARWARTPSQPVALEDLLRLLAYCLAHPAPSSRRFDVGCPEILTYRQMLERIAAILGLRRRFLDLPMQGTGWCRYWLSLVTGTPLALVGPLLESVQHPMVSEERRLQALAGVAGLGFDDAARTALAGGGVPATRSPRPRERASRVVRSVQRIPLPAGRSADWAAVRYGAWLPAFFRRLLRAETDEETGDVRLRLAWPPLTLLEHRLAQDRSRGSDRQVFYITGGLLARRVERATQRPRLEFREVLGGSTLLLAVHDYRPMLPWPLYRLIQAPLHAWVTRHFARYVARVGARGARGAAAGV